MTRYNNLATIISLRLLASFSRNLKTGKLQVTIVNYIEVKKEGNLINKNNAILLKYQVSKYTKNNIILLKYQVSKYTRYSCYSFVLLFIYLFRYICLFYLLFVYLFF